MSPEVIALNGAGIAVVAPSHKAIVKAASAAPKYKKAPDAPKRFKSAFIIFSAEKHKTIKEDLAKLGRSEKVRSLHGWWFAFWT